MSSERKLDWQPRFDARSRGWAVRNLIRPVVPKSRFWTPGAQLDQGQEGACVGNGWAGEGGATPIRYKIDQHLATDVYRLAQELDDWEGHDYEGTSVLAGAKAMVNLGMVKNYHWAFGLHDVLMALSYKGPVVLGLNWWTGMFDADKTGFIRPTGKIEGGHCVYAYQINAEEKTITIRNSWGSDWGVNGSAKMTWADLEKLLADQGEACVPTDFSQHKKLALSNGKVLERKSGLSNVADAVKEKLVPLVAGGTVA